MSSTLGPESAYCFHEKHHLAIPPVEQVTEHSISNNSSGWNEEPAWQRLFRNGLPTPPTVKAMTGLALKNHYNNAVHPSARSVSKHGQRNGLSSENSTGERNSVGREQERLSYSNRPERHRPSSSRDFGFDTKKSSGNVIASSFRIPESVNSSGGSIAEFAAEVDFQARLGWRMLTGGPDHLLILVRVRSDLATC